MTAGVVETPIGKIIDRVRQRVDERLAGFLDAHSAPAADPAVARGYGLLREFVTGGGKRIRPILCYWGWRGAAGEDEPEEPVIVAGAALELYHAGLLIHDDIMDGSELRRERPTIHRSLSGADRQRAGEAFGRSAAILLGVLAQAWGDQLLGDVEADPERTHTIRTLFNQMRSEVICGQYLDILARMRDGATVEQALTVIRYKTARYTVERPLQIGGALAGAGPALLEAYSRFALPLGEAFQLRDDILGVFGETAVTGKPVVDDLREGKQTALIAYASEHARGPQLELLRTWHGAPGLDERHAGLLREVIVDTGALAHVEALIDQRVVRALGELRGCAIRPQAAEALELLTDRLTRRVR